MGRVTRARLRGGAREEVVGGEVVEEVGVDGERERGRDAAVICTVAEAGGE